VLKTVFGVLPLFHLQKNEKKVIICYL